MKKFLLIAFLAPAFSFAQCPPGQVLIEVDITPDNYPGESSWQILTPPPANTLIASGTINDTTFCYNANSCLVFKMLDSFGDGLCCGYGNGSYSVVVGGQVQAQGGQFGYSETTWINCGPGESCISSIPINPGSYVAPIADTWYSFVPDSTGMYEIHTCGNSCDTKIWVYDHCTGLNWGAGNQGTVFYNDDNAQCGYQAVVSGIFTAGVTYYIRIGQYNTSCGSNPISWTLNYMGPVVGCMDPGACNYNPLATVDDGSCLYAPDPNCGGPDLMIVGNTIATSLYLDNVNSQNCHVVEGCMNGYGLRDVLRFTTHIKNIGNEDYYIGVPSAANPQFTYGNCHGHWHYEGYAAYLLYDMQGNEIPIGFKNGFCVLDLECSGGGTPTYGCGNMGIAHGCGDIYSSGLECQWIDITDVDTGTYQLVVKVNWDGDPDFNGKYETDMSNNFADVCIHLARNSSGIPSFTVVQNCPQFTDCMGVPYGSAKYDCQGICNGPNIRGDMNADSALTQVDAMLYVNGLINNTVPQINCRDMDMDGTWTVHDAALINNCTQNGPLPTNDPCDFPFGVTNINDTTSLSILNVNFPQQYVDIAIKNPNNRVIAYQFNMAGIQIQSVQNLVSPLEYNITPQWSSIDQEVIGISYQQMMVDPNNAPDVLCRIYYSYVTGSTICIDNIVDIVNQDYEAVVPVIAGNCVPVPPQFGVEGIGNSVAMSIYPNPAKDIVNITISTGELDNATLELRDALGRLVHTIQYPNVGFQTVQLDMSGYVNGVYTLTLSTTNGILTEKVILSR